jgi:hypothetical protein
MDGDDTDIQTNLLGMSGGEDFGLLLPAKGHHTKRQKSYASAPGDRQGVKGESPVL